MKALWSGVIAVSLSLCACEKRKGGLLPPRDAAAAKTEHKEEKEHGKPAAKMAAKSLPEGMVEGETKEPDLLPMSDDEEVLDTQKAKLEALDRIKKSPDKGKAAALFSRGRKLVASGHVHEGQELFLLACQLGHPEGCHKFGWQEERSGNVSNARQFYKIACEGGLSKSCNNLGFQLEKAQHWDEALDFYARACLEKHTTGCENLKRLRNDRLKAR